MLSFSTAPDAPANFTVTATGPESVMATWSNPPDTNGIILRFNLSVELGMGQGYLTKPQVTMFKINSDQFELSIQQLHPFAEYVFLLSAETSFGAGNVTDVLAITHEAGRAY